MSFGRETGVFGPDAGSYVAGSGTGSGCGEGGDEGRAGRRKDWRGEFARRGVGGGGYVVL